MSRFGDLVGGKKAAPAPTPTPEPVVEETVEVAESPIVEEDTTSYEEKIEEEVVETLPYDSLRDMTKKELEEYGRTLGIELDKRHSRKRLIQELKEHVDNL
jgi:hypothetical protein